MFPDDKKHFWNDRPQTALCIRLV